MAKDVIVKLTNREGFVVNMTGGVGGGYGTAKLGTAVLGTMVIGSK